MREDSPIWRTLLAAVACALAQPAVTFAQADNAAAANDAAATEVSPLAVEPKTPVELFDAVLLMHEIARPTLAKAYLARLLAESPDEAALLELRDKFGPAPFVKLTNNKSLQPEADKLLDLVTAAAAKRAADPERLAMLVKNLGGNLEEQISAREELIASGELVVSSLIAVLNDPNAASTHKPILDVLYHMGEPAVPALLGAIAAPPPALRAHAMTLLGHLHVDAAIPHLYTPVVSETEAPEVRTAAKDALSRLLGVSPSQIDRMTSTGVVPRLLQIAREHYRGEYPWPVDSNGLVTQWRWDENVGTVLPGQLKPDEASDLLGEFFARQALSLAPARRDAQVLFLSLALAAESRVAGLGKRLPSGPETAHDLALSVGPEVMGDVLADALASGRPTTAIAALQVLEQIGTAAQLKGTSLRRAPLTAALNYPDRRVQFAAATAVLQLDPQSSFSDAPRVVSILNRALTNSARPHAVIADPATDRGSAVGGLLSELGYAPLLVTSGKEAFRVAAERQDVELVVLHPNVVRWALTETLANLRADARTASLPIVLLGPADLRSKMSVHLANYRMITFASESQTPADLDLQIRPFLTQVQTPPLTEPELAAQKSAAVSWLAHIAGGRRTKVFDIRPADENLGLALDVASLAPDALQALGEIPSAFAQRRLARLVVDTNADAKLRETAAVKLAFHIQRFSLLLDPAQLPLLHAAADSATDPLLQTALRSVIGSLKPNSALVGKRLQSFPGN